VTLAVAWYLVAGGLLLLMSLGGALLQRLPLTSACLYLAVGLAVGAPAVGLVALDFRADAALLERLTEVAVLVSLFTAGLKLRLPLLHRDWRLPMLLATVCMLLTVALVTVVGVVALGLPLGAAVLLGGILAPTDPVLASDVQVTHALDRDRVRFGLTGEAGFNDGTAFPFVLLGLGLLGLHDLGAAGWRWFVVDVGWAVFAGLGVGWFVGTGLGHLALRIRRARTEAVGLDDFLGLGVTGLAYGVALLLGTYGFLAVFCAGLALRRLERRFEAAAGPPWQRDVPGGGRAEAQSPAYMLRGLVGFNERLERVAEVGIVLLIGAVLSERAVSGEAVAFALVLLLLIRPISVSLAPLPLDVAARGLVAWFGVRGIGSLYYLSYATVRGLPPALAERLATLTLTVVAVSIVLHGLSMTPLMNLYARRRGVAHRG
jgi:NhaP-type Na+/H+ or K+/H+ antiporter